MLDANTALAKKFPKYIKLAKIAMVHLLKSVEDEHSFSILKSIKDSLQNRLPHDHLSVIISVHG